MSETIPSTTFTHFLSKSRFIRGLQCHKALWLQTHRPELQDEVSASQQAVFDAGTSVGILAQALYPGGIEVPYDGMTYEEQIAMTREEIQKGTSTLYEATFSYDGVFCKVDILHRGENGWELHEVKSSNDVERKLKSHAYDYYPRGRMISFPKRQTVRQYVDRCMDNRPASVSFKGKFHNSSYDSCNDLVLTDESAQKWAALVAGCFGKEVHA